MISEIFGTLHPALVSFPFALVIFAICCEIWAVFKPNAIIEGAANIALGAALATAIAAYFSGHEASESVNQTFIVADTEVGRHFLFAKIFLFTLITCVIFKFVSQTAKFNKRFFKAVYFLFLTAAGALVIYTGLLGGKLVFEHGAGVKAVLTPG